MSIQSVIFPIEIYTINEAINWLKLHKLKHNKVDFKHAYYRFRQFNPKKNSHYYTKVLDDGIHLIISY